MTPAMVSWDGQAVPSAAGIDAYRGQHSHDGRTQVAVSYGTRGELGPSPAGCRQGGAVVGGRGVQANSGFAHVR